MMNHKLVEKSKALSFYLRHNKDAVNMGMDVHGFVPVSELLKVLNITAAELDLLVSEDNKKRYFYNTDKTCLCCCQGHSISWVSPLIDYDCEPPSVLWHGTTYQALSKIYNTGFIDKMSRHAVHMHSDKEIVSASARRWGGCTPVLIGINVLQMIADGYKFGKALNGVWCVDKVPVQYIFTEDL